MRPNQLLIEAFGPYAERAEVDFDALADTRLFVVSGPTGAGKTSIFDAMCWALYGVLPGNRLGEGRVRADAAAPDRLTSVTLTFSIDDTSYRVMRQPEQERPKVRGTGTTTEKQRVELHRRIAGAWEPMSHRWSETNRVCAELVGLTAAQFQQVVLLPQGRFQEVLHAGSGDRTELLRSLFDTAGFERAEALLDRRAKAAEARRDALEQEVGRSEALAVEELEALESLIESQGIELPPVEPVVTAEAPTPTTTADEPSAETASPLADAGPTKRTTGGRARRSEAPGQLSLVPDEDDLEPDAAAEPAGRAPDAPEEAADPPVETAGGVLPVAPSLAERADRLDLHGVVPLLARRDADRAARDTAETALNRARQLANRQAQFHDDRAVLNERVRRLPKVEANCNRLDAALRAAAVDGVRQASLRATRHFDQAQTSTDAAMRQAATQLDALVALWPPTAADRARPTDERRPKWLDVACGLDLTAVPHMGRSQLAEALEVLAQRSDRAGGDFRNRAGEIATARGHVQQASARRAEADAAGRRLEQVAVELNTATAQQRTLDDERAAAAASAAGIDGARAAHTEATQLRDARVSLDTERQALAEIESELAAVDRLTQELNDNLERLTDQRETARRVADALAEHRSQAERAAADVRLAQRRDQAEAELAEATAQARQCGAAYNELMAAFTADAAPSLAGSLVDGEDCPVCGSVDHPRPAAAPEGSEPASSANLERAHQANLQAISARSAIEDRLARCRSELGDGATEPLGTLIERGRAPEQLVAQALAASADAMEIDRQLTGLEQQRHGLGQRDRAAHVSQAATQQRLVTLAERLGTSVDADLSDLNARLAAATEAARRCGAAVDTVAALDLRRGELDRQVEVLTARRSEAEGQQLAASTQAEHLDALATTELSKHDADWPHAQLAQASEALATAARRAATTLDTLVSAEQTADEAGSALEKALKHSGFSDAGTAEAACLSPEEQRRLEASISRWDGEGFALTERLVATVEGGLDLTPPNLEQLQARLAAADDAANRLTEQATTARNHLGRARRAIAELDDRGDERSAAQADYRASHRLARMCRGYNPGRVTLEAWVLAHHLREVVTAANHRLGAMSRGRFQIHVDDEAADQRAKHGLDLSIADAETGTRRPVRTLSGGQTFQASLALALGLADTIAVQRVGRDIGATFIDEGFGGLDSDSLDTAIEVLANLGAEGQMIGVITHVEELKAVLPVAIEVTPLGGGRSELTQLIGGPLSSSAAQGAEVA